MICKFLFPLLLVSSILGSFSFAQTENDIQSPKNSEEELIEISEEQEKIERLKRFRSELITLNSEIRRIERELDSDINMVARIQQETRLVTLKKDFEIRQFRFIQAIAGVNLAQDEEAQESSFTEDIKQILDPVVQTFKKVSEKPRRVQNLADKKERINTRLAKAKTAQAELEKFMQENKEKSLKARLRESLKVVKKMVAELEKKSDDVEFEENVLEENEESIVTTFSGLIFDFITTKGKNLVLSLLVFALVYWGFRYGQEKILGLLLFRLQRSENKDFYDWVIRPTRVIYSVFTFFVSFFMGILTLYVLNDWVLVTIILITFAALIWSSKQYIPVFFEQSKIVLNLGAVREDERLIYKGLPWKIKNLGYYGRLYNPELEGGLLRISTKEMLNLNSRKFSPSERWFPTTKGDWIEHGEIFGEVIMQTPEQVIVQLIGGEKKYYTASEFYESGVINLSEEFCVEFIFGVDYGHQMVLLSEIIPTFKDYIFERLQQDYPQAKQSLKRHSLEFRQAGSSSLDLRVFFKFSGDVASLKLQIERSLQSYLLEACNREQIVIPFNQLTVHMQQ